MLESANEKKLIELLDSIDDAFDNFHSGIIKGCKTVENGIEKMLEYVENTPNITTSLVVRHLADMRGIKRNLIN